MSFDFDEDDKKAFKKNDRCFKILEHEDKLFTTRVNLLLVAESLLFLAYVTTICCVENIKNCVSVIFALIGLIITIFIGFVNIRASLYLKELNESIDNVFPFYKKMRRKRIFGSANIVLGWLITFIFIIAWVVLLVLNLCCD